MIIDANVLIDYAHTQPKILLLAARHIGTLHVSRLLLQQEVCELNESDGEQLGLDLVKLSTEQFLKVGRLRRSLSFHDRTCLVLAKENRWACVTNDKPLRQVCTAEGIRVLWGLELMVELVRVRELKPDAAIEIATAIGKSNPKYITESSLDRFAVRVSRIAAGRNDR